MVLLPPDAFLADLSRVFSACQRGSVYITIKAQAARKVRGAGLLLRALSCMTVLQGCAAEGSCIIRAKGRRGKLAAGAFSSGLPPRSAVPPQLLLSPCHLR